MRFGLCCQFSEEPIKFRSTTAAYLKRRRAKGESVREYLAEIVKHNLRSLQEALRYCQNHHIRCFRISSQLLPLYTHPEVGYRWQELSNAEVLQALFTACRTMAKESDIRLLFHPDQFVVLNSPKRAVVEASLQEMAYHAEMAEQLGAEVLILHGGGKYGDAKGALARLHQGVELLLPEARSRLVLENDDRIWTPEELLPLCEERGIPFVYDVHHHRCHPDSLSVEEVTQRAVATWRGREPLFHISSPKGGWQANNPRAHADFIDVEDFPEVWRSLDPLTVEVEAKLKEVAVLHLQEQLLSQ